MFDTIPQIVDDSVPFFLKREVELVEQSDTLSVGFSSLDVVPRDVTGVLFSPDSVLAKLPEGIKGIGLPFSDSFYSVFFLVFLLCFALLAFFSNSMGYHMFVSFKELFVLGGRRRSIYKAQVTASSIWVEVFLTFQAILISSMVLYTFIYISGYGATGMMRPILLFVIIFSGLFVLLMLKYLVYWATDFLFPEWGFREWTGRFFTLVALAGMMLFLPALFYIFTPEFRDTSLIFILGVLFIVMLIMFGNLFVIFEKNKIGLLNYFLYLCAVEIVPLFILYKVVGMII